MQSWIGLLHYVVKIETPRGHGTGFLCFYNQTRTFIGIATARRVVSYADEWQQPIRLHHFPSSTTVFLKESDRTILSDVDTDSAVILTQPGERSASREYDHHSSQLVSRFLLGKMLVGWGFPALAASTLCFFSGIISARQEWRHAYLIDGVSINGVSGGPVIYSTETDGVQIVGTVSAYVSNRATGDALPGLAIAKDVSRFHDTITMLNSLDEARAKKQELAEEKQAQGPELPTH